MTVTPLFPACQCSRCRRDDRDERLMRQLLDFAIEKESREPMVESFAESLARAVKDLNDELAGVSD